MPVTNHKFNGIFVTGTDTGVGKTLISSALARLLTERGLRVGVMKPAESGVADPDKLGADASLLKWASNCSSPDDEISPYRFRPALSPAQAASKEKIFIDFSKLISTAHSLGEVHDFLIIEGAGGFMSPLSGGLLMADLARSIGLPLLLTTTPRLGTLNHTLLTIFAAQQMDIPLVGYLINRMPAHPDEAEENTPHNLASLASADILGVLPEVEGDDRDKVLSLVTELKRMPTLHWLLAALKVS